MCFFKSVNNHHILLQKKIKPDDIHSGLICQSWDLKFVLQLFQSNVSPVNFNPSPIVDLK